MYYDLVLENNVYLLGTVDRKPGTAEADKYQVDRWWVGHCHTDRSDQENTCGLSRYTVKVKESQYINRLCLDTLWQLC